MPSERSATEMRLLAAAAALLESGGMEAVTTRAVLDEAGLSAPTLYHHFGDKDGLLGALLQDGLARFFGHRGTLPVTEDVVADFERSLDGFFDFVCEQPQLYRLLSVKAEGNPELMSAATEWCRMRLQTLEDEGRLLVDVAFALQALTVVSLGVAALRMQGESDVTLRETGRFLFRHTLSGFVRLG